MKAESTKDTAEYYKHLSVFWTDLIHLMSSKPQALSSVGPMRNFAENAKKISKELIEANEDLVEFNKSMREYYKQLTDTWNDAQKKVNFKTPEIPNDPEQYETYKRVWIDIFDNDFTELFDSKRFGENYGKLVAKELELIKLPKDKIIEKVKNDVKTRYAEMIQNHGMDVNRQTAIDNKWIEIKSQNIREDILGFANEIDFGEVAVISLALRLKSSLVIMDDASARTIAEGMGLNVKGTLFVLLSAYKKNYLDKNEFISLINELVFLGFRISQELYVQLMDELKD